VKSCEDFTLLSPTRIASTRWQPPSTQTEKMGGPILQSIVTNRPALYGRLTYTTMAEQLQARGISWKVYSSPDETVLGGILSDNVLSYFKNFQDPGSVLHQNAFGPQFPVDFLADMAFGNLPQVSWLVGSILTSDHPPSPSLFGENILSLVVSALTANPPLWAKTVLFVTYDENGGFFDHVAPVTAPLGTPGEYVTAPPMPDATVIGSPAITGPIGLGFRVPTLIISPFTRGGFVSSDLFDHPSVLRFLETRFGAEVPNLSAWRRATVGDLTSTLNFKKPDQSIPNLPSTPAWRSAGDLAMCREPGRNDTLPTAKHSDRSDSGSGNCDSSQWRVLATKGGRGGAQFPGWSRVWA
jgi:phospholipase C